MLFGNNVILDSRLNKIYNKDLQSDVIALSRSLLAFSLLITLLLANPNHFFNPTFQPNPSHNFLPITKISIFYLLYPHQLILAKIIAIIILLLTVLGVYPRYFCILHWYITFSFYASNFCLEGGDQVASILTLLFIPICIIDNRKNHWHKTQNTILDEGKIYKAFKINAYLSYLCIRLQVGIIYLNSSIGKLKVDEWVNGTVLYYWFTEPVFGIPNFLYPFVMPIIENKFLLPVLTWSSLLLEFLLFLGILIDVKHRKLLFLLGILFHFFIFVFHGLFSFSVVMVGALVIYLVPLDKYNEFIIFKFKRSNLSAI